MTFRGHKSRPAGRFVRTPHAHGSRKCRAAGNDRMLPKRNTHLVTYRARYTHTRLTHGPESYGITRKVAVGVTTETCRRYDHIQLYTLYRYVFLLLFFFFLPFLASFPVRYISILFYSFFFYFFLLLLSYILYSVSAIPTMYAARIVAAIHSRKLRPRDPSTRVRPAVA